MSKEFIENTPEALAADIREAVETINQNATALMQFGFSVDIDPKRFVVMSPAYDTQRGFNQFEANITKTVVL